MRLLGHDNTSTTAAFYAGTTMDMMREAINTATPAINDPGSSKTGCKPSTASDDARSLSRGTTQPTAPAQAKPSFLGLTETSA